MAFSHPRTTDLDQWVKLFTDRQHVTQRTMIRAIIDTRSEMVAMHGSNIADAIAGFLACIMDRQARLWECGMHMGECP